MKYLYVENTSFLFSAIDLVDVIAAVYQSQVLYTQDSPSSVAYSFDYERTEKLP